MRRTLKLKKKKDREKKVCKRSSQNYFFIEYSCFASCLAERRNQRAHCFQFNPPRRGISSSSLLHFPKWMQNNIVVLRNARGYKRNSARLLSASERSSNISRRWKFLRIEWARGRRRTPLAANTRLLFTIIIARNYRELPARTTIHSRCYFVAVERGRC